MPPNKKKLICIICLKRFLPLDETDNINEILPIVKISSSLNPDSEYLNISSETTQRNVVENGKDFGDPYTRFLLFVKRYFKLTIFADRLLVCAREAKNENGERIKLHTFCDSCGELVSDICKLYKELQTAQLFLIWKLSLVGELMKKSSGHATDDKTYKSWGARTSMAKQMNVIAVKPVDLFRKALQLKCVNAVKKGKAKPVVILHKGLSPDQWKFTYSAVKEVLIRLITVFTLASTELSEDRPNREVTTVAEKIVEVKNLGKRRRHGGTSTTRKIHPSQFPENKLNAAEKWPIKIETENLQMDVTMNENGLLGNENEAPVPSENLGNDSDWSRGAPSPMSVHSNVSDGDYHADIQAPVEAPEKTINLKKRRKIFVQVEEEDDYDVATAYRDDNAEENDIKVEKELPSRFKHKQEATIKCPHCPALFVKPRGLGQHLRFYHHKNLHYSCKNCGMRFKRHREFMRHHQKMHPKMFAEFSNNIPGGISTPRRRVRLRNGVTKYEEGPYIPADPGACTQCSKVFATRTEMIRHRQRIHITKWNKIEVYWRVLEMDKRLDPISPPPTPEVAEEPYNIHVKGKSGRPKRNYLNQKELTLSEKYRKLDCEVESCGLTFETAYLLRKHLENVHEDGIEESEKKVQCCYCDKRFVHNQSYEIHVRTMHRTKIFGAFVCDFDNCERSVRIPFHSLTDLNEHLEYHLNEESCGIEEISYCEKCNWGFVRPEVRDLHQLLHIPVEKDGRIQCSKCEEKCVDMHTLQDHFIDKHDLKGVRALQCDECEKRYFTKNTFTKHKIWHQRKHYFGPSNSLECEVCGDKFKNRDCLENHAKEHDPGYFIVCKEPGCGKKFGNRRKLQIHVTNTHRAKEWVCELCGEKYAKRTILMGHLKTHEEAKWPCDVCGMKFKRKDKVKAHKRSMHNPDRVHAFVCSECGKGYHNPYGLKYHIDSSHKPESEWELKCPRCPRRFYRKLFLDLHLKKCDGGGDDGVSGELKGKETRENSRKRKRKEEGDQEDEEREISDKNATENAETDEKPETSGNAPNEELFKTIYQPSSEMLLAQYNQLSEPVGNMPIYQQFIPFLEQQQQRIGSKNLTNPP